MRRARDPRTGAAGALLGALALVLTAGPGQAWFHRRPAAPPPTAAAPPSPPPLPTVRLGALLPLTGPAAWYGQEMRQGLELALAELNPPPVATPGTVAGPGPGSPPTPGAAPGSVSRARDAGGLTRTPGEAAARTPTPGSTPAAEGPESEAPPAGAEAGGPETRAGPGAAAPGGGPAGRGGTERTGAGAPLEPAVSRPSPGVRFLLEPVDLPAAIPRRAAEAFARLAAQGAPVVLTASATPTAAVAPLAAERDVLVIHQGAVTARVAALGPLVLHLRAPLAPRVDALTAVAHDVGLRRLGLLAAGDEFGKAVRARLAPRWRAAGATLAVEVSTGLEDPDLPGHLRRLTRAGVDGVCLAFRGLDLGDLAVALRAAGYAGPVLALDDDPAALLAGGPALEGALVVADAFLPEPGAPSERFARAYEARFKRPPSRYAANAYDAVGLVAEALRTARQASVAPPGGSRLRAALLERQRLPSVYGGELVVRDDGTLGRPLALLRVEHGSPVLVRYLPVEAPAP